MPGAACLQPQGSALPDDEDGSRREASAGGAGQLHLHPNGPHACLPFEQLWLPPAALCGRGPAWIPSGQPPSSHLSLGLSMCCGPVGPFRWPWVAQRPGWGSGRPLSGQGVVTTVPNLTDGLRTGGCARAGCDLTGLSSGGREGPRRPGRGRPEGRCSRAPWPGGLLGGVSSIDLGASEA